MGGVNSVPFSGSNFAFYRILAELVCSNAFPAYIFQKQPTNMPPYVLSLRKPSGHDGFAGKFTLSLARSTRPDSDLRKNTCSRSRVENLEWSSDWKKLLINIKRNIAVVKLTNPKNTRRTVSLSLKPFEFKRFAFTSMVREKEISIYLDERMLYNAI